MEVQEKRQRAEYLQQYRETWKEIKADVMGMLPQEKLEAEEQAKITLVEEYQSDYIQETYDNAVSEVDKKIQEVRTESSRTMIMTRKQ